MADEEAADPVQEPEDAGDENDEVDLTGHGGRPRELGDDDEAARRAGFLDAADYRAWKAANAAGISEEVRRIEARTREAAAAENGGDSALRVYAFAADELLALLGAANARLVQSAHASAQLAILRRISRLAQDADPEALQRLADVYLTLPSPGEDWSESGEA